MNPVFWKLHGWVDDCIGAWQAAHDAAHPGQVQPKVARGIPWYAPGPWVVKADPFDWPGAGDSGGHHHGEHGHAGDEEAALEQVIALLKAVDGRAEPTPASAIEGEIRHMSGRRLSGFARFAIPDQWED